MSDRIGVPYAPVYFRGAQACVDCPECGATFPLLVPKDEESNSTIDYAKHYEGAHEGNPLAVPGGVLWIVDPCYLQDHVVPSPGPRPREHIFRGIRGTGLILQTPEQVQAYYDRRHVPEWGMRIADITFLWGQVESWQDGGDELAVDSATLVAISPEAVKQWTEGEDPFEEGTDGYNAFLVRTENNTSCAGAGTFEATGGSVFATSTGLGDGVYPWSMGLDKEGAIVGVRVHFLDPDE